jgi:hypothetical protein
MFDELWDEDVGVLWLRAASRKGIHVGSSKGRSCLNFGRALRPKRRFQSRIRLGLIRGSPTAKKREKKNSTLIQS